MAPMQGEVLVVVPKGFNILWKFATDTPKRFVTHVPLLSRKHEKEVKNKPQFIELSMKLNNQQKANIGKVRLLVCLIPSQDAPPQSFRAYEFGAPAMLTADQR
jgi:hypothetical protein